MRSHALRERYEPSPRSPSRRRPGRARRRRCSCRTAPRRAFRRRRASRRTAVGEPSAAMVACPWRRRTRRPRAGDRDPERACVERGDGGEAELQRVPLMCVAPSEVTVVEPCVSVTSRFAGAPSVALSAGTKSTTTAKLEVGAPMTEPVAGVTDGVRCRMVAIRGVWPVSRLRRLPQAPRRRPRRRPGRGS